MCWTLHCSENIRTALKPDVRIWSLVPPEPRSQVPPGLLQSVPWAMSSCQGAQDWQQRSRDTLYTLETFFWCGQVLGFGHLPRNAWRTGQRWTPTILDTHNSTHRFLTQDRAWLHCLALLTPTHTQAASWSQQATTTALDCTPRSSGKPASSTSHIKVGSYTGPAEKDLCRSSVSMDSGHLLCFPFLLNKCQIFYTSTEIYFFNKVFYQHSKVKLS